jgi:hypothetical protein
MRNYQRITGHTSIKLRIDHAKENLQPKSLLPFVGNHQFKVLQSIPLKFLDYLQLIALTGRCIREDKAGYIEEHTPGILQRLNIEPENWLMLTYNSKKFFMVLLGMRKL